MSSSFVRAGVVVGVSGELERAVSPRVWGGVVVAVDAAARSSVVVLDLTKVGFLDSLGVTMLLNLHQRSRHQQVQLRVVTEPAQFVRRVLSLSGVDSLLAIHDSIEDATSALSSLPRTIPPPPAYTQHRPGGQQAEGGAHHNSPSPL